LLDKALKSIEPFTPKQEKHSIYCLSCGQPATKLVSYTVKGAIILEKHCDKCAKNVEDDFDLQTKRSQYYG
jgi:hypothetical protein